MSWKKIGLLVVLVDFLALNAWVIHRIGYLGFYEAVLGSVASVALLVDLVIALGLVALWMVRDAREQGISPAPYLALTLLLGSVGPLAYLLRRPEDRPAGAAARAGMAAAR